MPTNSSHLSRDDLLRAVIDLSDLPEACRRHLEQCPACQSKQTDLAHQLGQLSETAARLVPAPRPRTTAILAGEKPQKKRTVSFYRGLMPTMSAALLLLFLFSIMVFTQTFNEQKTISAPTETALLNERQAEAAFAAEIESLEAYALSGFTRQAEESRYTSDEFLNFVAPLEETDVRSDMSYHIRHSVYPGVLT